MLAWLFGSRGAQQSPEYVSAARRFTESELGLVSERWARRFGGCSARVGEAEFVGGALGLPNGSRLGGMIFHAAAGYSPGAPSPPGEETVGLEEAVVCLAAAQGSEGEQAEFAHRVVAGGRDEVSRELLVEAVLACAAVACGGGGSVTVVAAGAGAGTGAAAGAAAAGAGAAAGAVAAGAGAGAEQDLAEFAASLVSGLCPPDGPWEGGPGLLALRPIACVTGAIASTTRRLAPPPLPAAAGAGPAPALRGGIPALDTPLAGGACLLRAEWAWLLAAGLPEPLRRRWRLGFNSKAHGHSYTVFSSRVVGQGPALVLVREQGGGVIGGVSDASLERNATFFGGFQCHVFSLLPEVAVYWPSGVNENFLWCASGYSSVPNGVGFGGQVGHFAAFVDAGFDTGMTRPSATYASPSLLPAPLFAVDAVECWLLGDPPEEEGGQKGAGGRSVLERFKEDRAAMQLLGMKDHSEGLRG